MSPRGPLVIRLLLLSLGVGTSLSCGGAADVGCNGHPELCERRYDEVAYATTHNAHASTADRFAPPNQTSGLTQQLEDGVRGFMLDTYYDDRFGGAPALCHGACVFGRRPLVDGLRELNDFLEAHPREVITIIFESYISAEDTLSSFEESGLLARTYAHTAGEAWPTLGELVAAGTRVVVFTDREGDTYDWYMDVWDHSWETHYSAETPEDFSCDPNRGDTANSLFIFNHFLTSPFASAELAGMVNDNPTFFDRVQECQTASGDFANFITVDFYEIGDVLAVTNTLNGF